MILQWTMKIPSQYGGLVSRAIGNKGNVRGKVREGYSQWVAPCDAGRVGIIARRGEYDFERAFPSKGAEMLAD